MVSLHCLAKSLGLSLGLGDFVIAEGQGKRREGEEVVERRQNSGGVVEKRRSTTVDNMEVVDEIQVGD